MDILIGTTAGLFRGPTNFLGITPDPDTVGGVLVGTDLGEVGASPPARHGRGSPPGFPTCRRSC